jgi:poly(3-hydroxybutyrate) depolymerase
VILLVALLLQGDLVERTLRENTKEQRIELRKLDVAVVEKALRSPSRDGVAPGLVQLQSKSDLDGEPFVYARHVPEGYDPSKGWPVLVTLHGTNGNGPDWIQTWLRCAAAREKLVIIAPTTTRHTWSARQGHAYVLSALRETMDQLHIDGNRVYLDGFSMGGGGSFRLASHHPDRWAAIAPRCNVPDIRQKKDKSFVTMLADNYRAVPVYWVVGAKDEKVSIELARAGKGDLEAAKAELVYREHPEGGHTWEMEKDEVVLDWFEKHVRSPYPEEVVFRSDEKIFSLAW